MTDRPAALLMPGFRTLTAYTAAGVHTADNRSRHAIDPVGRLLERLKGHTCYVGAGLLSLHQSTGARQWEAYTWRGRASRMVHVPSRCSVSSLRWALADAAGPEDAWRQLCEALAWLRTYDVQPSSLPRMAWNLWRASLTAPLEVGFSPEVGRAALYGGRQGVAECREYRHMVALDIEAAYPTEMAAASFGLRLRSVSPAVRLCPSTPGLALARVSVPSDVPFGPLPVRLAPGAIHFATGTLRGVWPWCELAATRELGFDVEVIEAWAPRREVTPFVRWWEMVKTGRELPSPGAQKIAKACANALWGSFAMTESERSVIRWADDKGEVPIEAVAKPASKPKPHAWCAYWAAETTARVRTRVLTEALYGNMAAPVQCHTDGVIVRRRTELPTGRGPGHWRVKERMRLLDLRAPQLYRYHCERLCCLRQPEWHYVAGGVPGSVAPEVFRREATSEGSRIGTRGDSDVVVPGHNAQDEAAHAHWLRMAGVVS